MIDLSDFAPVELGLPEAFPEFRESQCEFIRWVTASNRRFIAAGLPTGSGKSLSAMALARATGKRTAILTVTRGLEAQYLRDFASPLLINIHGKANYPCGEFNLNCRFGEIEGCRLAGNMGCTYECQRTVAKHSDIVLTNYAYWIRINEFTRGLEFTSTEAAVSGHANPFELLILDEAGRADQELARALAVKIRETWLRTAGFRGTSHRDSVGYWQSFASFHLLQIQAELATAQLELKRDRSKKSRDRVYELTELVESLEKIRWMQSADWVCELQAGTSWGRVWEFECAWPGGFAEQKLFAGIPMVVLMGATLKPAHLAALGIRKAEREFREWPRVFPPHHTPVCHIPTARINYRTGDEELLKWVATIDRIIDPRIEERKGIIHTVSYKRAKYLLEHSRHASSMILNSNDPESETAAEVVERFRRADPPAILVSPSFSTGWDFPYRECEWQIIAKLAFPESKSKVMQARKERNPAYIDQMVMQDLIQACGRGTRSEDDRCEVFVVDDNITWFLWRNKNLAPQWFEVRTVSQIPQPGRRCPDKRVAS